MRSQKDNRTTAAQIETVCGEYFVQMLQMGEKMMKKMKMLAASTKMMIGSVRRYFRNLCVFITSSPGKLIVCISNYAAELICCQKLFFVCFSFKKMVYFMYKELI